MRKIIDATKNRLLSETGKLPSTGRVKRFFKTYWYLLLCMLIPAVLTYLMYLARLVHPIGDGSVLVLDLNGQYVYFFEALRNFFKGDASLLYSFSRAMGGEFLGIYAYYLASPFSFLVCLFPKERMLEGLLTLFILKTAICGGTFGYYMHRTSKKPRAVAILIFSTFYALSSYAVVQQHNTMWIDAMMWLPLISLGIEELIKRGKFRLYTITLAVTLFSNFYIGYMVCIYCLFYFFLYYVAHGGAEGDGNPNGERLHFGKSLLRMAFFSLLAIGMALVILLGAYYSLSFGKSTFSNTQWVWNLNFDILDLLYKFLPDSYDTVRPDGYPFVYCGVLTLLLLPAYFLSKRFPMRQKICSVVFIFVFIASFSLTVPDLFWHGFQRPNWLNYRYSFMLCFYLCVLSCRALEAFETVSLRVVAGTGGFLALLCVLLQKYTDEAYVNPEDYTCIWFTILAIVFYLSILGVLRSGKGRQVACVALAVVVCAETYLNGLWSMNSLDQDVIYTSYSTYNSYLEETRPIVEAVQSKDQGFYRMETARDRRLNDCMALNLRGLSGSTSTLNQETVLFLQKMGYASQSHWSRYLGGTPVNDSLMGIKYIVADDTQEEFASYYEVYEKDGSKVVYRNPYALSLAYGVSEDLLEFPLGYDTSVDDDAKPQEKKESAIGKTLQSIKSFFNRKLGIEETVRDATYVDAYTSPFPRLNAIVTAMLGEEETVELFVPVTVTEEKAVGLPFPYYAEGHTCYSSSSGSAEGYVSYSFVAETDGELYFYLPTNYPREVTLRLYNHDTGENESYGSFGSGESYRIVSLGCHKAGESFTLRMYMKGTDLYYVSNHPTIYYLNTPVFEDAMSRLAADSYEITEHTEDSFLGTLTASREHELVMTTLAYDPGWVVTVDGQVVDTVKALGSTVAFFVDGAAGQTHEIRMVYRPRIVVFGAWVSLASTALFLVLALALPFWKRIPILRAFVSIPKRPLRVRIGGESKRKQSKKPSSTKNSTSKE